MVHDVAAGVDGAVRGRFAKPPGGQPPQHRQTEVVGWTKTGAKYNALMEPKWLLAGWSRTPDAPFEAIVTLNDQKMVLDTDHLTFWCHCSGVKVSREGISVQKQ